MSEQLKALSKPFDQRLIEKKPGKGDLSYVSHSSVTERALATVGPYSLEVQEVIYRDGKVDGALVTLECEIDGRKVRITEAGEGDNPTAKTNGALLKDAVSDAVKRCWMRLGLGLHLWSGELYVLDRVLEKRASEGAAEAPQAATQTAQEPAKPKAETITEKRAAGLRAELQKLGFDTSNEAQLLEEAFGLSELERFTDLTDGEAVVLWQRLKRKAADKAKPVYETWQNDEEAQAWGAKQGVFKSGSELMTLWADCKNDAEPYKAWHEVLTAKRLQAN